MYPRLRRTGYTDRKGCGLRKSAIHRQDDRRDESSSLIAQRVFSRHDVGKSGHRSKKPCRRDSRHSISAKRLLNSMGIPSKWGRRSDRTAIISAARAHHERCRAVHSGLFVSQTVIRAPVGAAAWGFRAAAVRKTTVPQSAPVAGAIANAMAPPTVQAAESPS